MYNLGLFPPNSTKHTVFMCFESQGSLLWHKIGTSYKVLLLGFAYIITLLLHYFWNYLHNEKGNSFFSITVNIKMCLSLLHGEGTLLFCFKT